MWRLDEMAETRQALATPLIGGDKQDIFRHGNALFCP
jgi:hypothetical protein